MSVLHCHLPSLTFNKIIPFFCNHDKKFCTSKFEKDKTNATENEGKTQTNQFSHFKYFDRSNEK